MMQDFTAGEIVVGIVGIKRAGKTTFLKKFTKDANVKIINRYEAASENGDTLTWDYFVVSHHNKVFVIIGTGGDRYPLTDYYRDVVLRKSSRIIVLFDLTQDFSVQIQFLKDTNLFSVSPEKIIVIALNKADLAEEKIQEFVEKIHKETHFSKATVFATCSIDAPLYQKYITNVCQAMFRAID